MAYTSFAPTDIDEMLSQIATFCSNDLGWTADYTGGVLTLTPKAGEAEFRLFEQDIVNATISDPDPGPAVAMEMEEGADYVRAAIGSVASTSLVWLHGGNSPEPWLLISILSAPGIYRHGALGYVAKYGTWSGGAFCDGVFWDYNNNPDRPRSYTHSTCHMLFASNTSYGRIYVDDGVNDTTAGDLDGGVFVRGVHGDSPVALFKSVNNYSGPRVGGGYLDPYAERARDPGTMPLSGEAALVPVTLFADMLRNDTWTPLGHVPGLRMVNITDLDPEQTYTYAGLIWKVFPLCRKSAGDYYSGDLGLAVLQEA